MVDASVMMFRDERDKGTNGVKTGRRNNKFMTIFSPLGCHGHDIQKKKNTEEVSKALNLRNNIR